MKSEHPSSLFVTDLYQKLIVKANHQLCSLLPCELTAIPGPKEATVAVGVDNIFIKVLLHYGGLLD
jgi:hypothetical protein